MNCPDYPDEKLLEAYGELDERAVEYRSHVHSCPGCRQDLAEIRGVSLHFRRGVTLPCARFRRFHRWGTSIAAAFFLAIFMGGVLPSTSPFEEHVGKTSVQPEPVPAWEQDESDWEEEIACLSNQIGSLELELRRGQ